MDETAMMRTDGMALAKPEDVGMSRERLQRIGDVLQREVDSGGLPGAVSLVARRGRVVHFKAFGARDPGSGAAMERDAIFRIYSMTKPIVSAGLMMLAEEGRFALSDPLSAFIPAFRDVRVAIDAGGSLDVVAAKREITIQDLLRHTSGLTYDWIDDGPLQRLYTEAGAGRRDRTNAEQAEVLARLPLLAQPGTAWHYGRSTDLVGRVIEILSGQSLGSFLQARLLEPLGMMETGFFVPPEYQHRIAEPFAIDPDNGEAVRPLDVRVVPKLENGGGGLVSTASDYARFLHMIASGGTLDGVRLLGRGTIALMMADHLDPSVVTTGSDLLPPGYGFGLGFAVRRTPGLAPFPGSTGDAYWNGLAGTSFWIDPKEDLYAVLMIQAPGRRDRYRKMFRHLVYAALAEPNGVG